MGGILCRLTVLSVVAVVVAHLKLWKNVVIPSNQETLMMELVIIKIAVNRYFSF